MEVTVIGSVNMDYLIRVPEIPRGGQTLLAESMQFTAGGKGANQAVAAARLGGRVRFCGCVGDDAAGRMLRESLSAAGVDVSLLDTSPDEPTGIAIVTVDRRAENAITVVPGANYAIREELVDEALASSESHVIVLQGEIRHDLLRHILERGHAMGRRLVLNLAPYADLDDAALRAADPVVLNEDEASMLTGDAVRDRDSALRVLPLILAKATSAVITLGADGAVWADASGQGHVRAETVRAVDTTGAGDAFVGALALGLARLSSLEEATAVAVSAGTYAVQSAGAQPSYPTRADLNLE